MNNNWSIVSVSSIETMLHHFCQKNLEINCWGMLSVRSTQNHAPPVVMTAEQQLENDLC